MAVKLILLSGEGKEKQFYLDSISRLDVRMDTVSTFKQLEKKLLESAYQGVLVDLKTKVRALKQEKELAYQILEQFPVVQLRLDEQTQEIKTLYYGKSIGDGTLEEFILRDCRFFEPRILRAAHRVRIHFNVMLSPTGLFSEADAEKTITCDVSRGGCFLFSSRKHHYRQRVFLIFADLKDRTPIIGEVRWVKNWGEALQIPGIGVEFKEITDGQISKICRTARLKP
ncbi:MAG: PilZ domain-containing protein [Desulfobacteraceae bacterium]|nr:MAG: PilZ domain-containing protein [Desulfobacteraceae bacterium]